MPNDEPRPYDEAAALQEIARNNVAAAKAAREAVLRSMAAPFRAAPDGTAGSG